MGLVNGLIPFPCPTFEILRRVFALRGAGMRGTRLAGARAWLRNFTWET